MKTMDRRIAARRRQVKEDRARHRLRWLIGMMLLAAAVGFGIWALQSPLLAVRTITVAGAEHADVEAVLADSGIVVGKPTVSVRAASIEAELIADPWVAAADVAVTWPGAIEVAIVEHRPVAWVATTDRWMLAAADGSILDVALEPTQGLGRIRVGAAARLPGARLTGRATLGALRFLAELPGGLAGGTIVSVSGDSLSAEVAGHVVRLGPAEDMNRKANVLEALLADGIPRGANVDLIAPLRPAIDDSQRQVEGETTSGTDGQPSD